MSNKKATSKKKKVSNLHNASEYRKSIARLNYAKGLKPGDRGYLTPSAALNDYRKYSNVEKIESQIAKVKEQNAVKAERKSMNKVVREYNKYNRYKKGDAGYITIDRALTEIGKTEFIDITAEVKRRNYETVRYQDRYQRNVNESLRDEAKLKEQASRILILNNSINALYDKMNLAQTAQEYEGYKKQIADLSERLHSDFLSYAQQERDIRDKWKKRNKIPLDARKELTLDIVKRLSNTSIAEQLERMLDDERKDSRGNPLSLHAIYRNMATNTAKSILDATLNTKVSVDGEEMVLSDIIYFDKIDNKLFWNAFHAWEKDGGIVVSKNGRKYPDYISASNFFTSLEGSKLLDSLLTAEYQNSNIIFE